MWVDYTSLNKACLKDSFSLPHNDQVVDLTAGCELQSFLDTYSGCYQVSLAEANQPTTTFIAPFGCFCHVKMSFRLNNTWAPYQQCI
jgi:hypothetical protein